MGWKRLTGGLTSIVHRLTVERNGLREQYVLRWWVPDSKWEQWIARAVPLETAVLTTLLLSSGSEIGHCWDARNRRRIQGEGQKFDLAWS